MGPGGGGCKQKRRDATETNGLTVGVNKIMCTAEISTDRQEPLANGKENREGKKKGGGGGGKGKKERKTEEKKQK